MKRGPSIHCVEQRKLVTWLAVLVVAIVVCGSHVADAQSASKFVYKISNGEMRLGSQLLGTGYSGKKGVWRNNPSRTSEKDKGPLPVGVYSIGRVYDAPKKQGPIVLPLSPIGGQNMFGRTDFLIHGDNSISDASTGCIILGPSIRQKIANSPVKKLEVIA